MVQVNLVLLRLEFFLLAILFESCLVHFRCFQDSGSGLGIENLFPRSLFQAFYFKKF